MWHVPRLAKSMETDSSPECRILAAQIIKKVVANKMTSVWWYRLESRDAALEAARRLVSDQQTSPPLRDAAKQILQAWGSFVDRPLLEHAHAWEQPVQAIG